MKFFAIHIVFVLLLFQSCSALQLNKSDYVKFIENEENGLKVKKEIGDKIFSLQYEPTDYVLLKSGQNKIDKKELEGSEFYTLEVREEKGKDILNLSEKGQDYNLKMEYLINDMQKDIKLIVGEDTISCSEFHMERGYDITSRARFMFSFTSEIFKKEEAGNMDRVIEFNDKVFGTGKIYITVESSAIENIPALDYGKDI